MAWLSVNESGQEVINETRPERWDFHDGLGNWESQDSNYPVRLPDGSIERLIGRKLTWDDDPVEIK